MTIFYLDPVGGNDANAGTSFETRWQSIGLGATAARISPGDTIRIIESPAPVSMGVNATFTLNVSATSTFTAGSNVINLSEAVTSDINLCETAWTASTNVTTSTASATIQGTNCSQAVIAAGFTTGVAAYQTVTQKDYTGYTRVSFWIAQSAGTLAIAGDYSLALCSDTAGQVPVVTIPVPVIKATNTWRSVVYDFAGDLPANINSVALVVNVDRGAVTIQIDNIYACLPASNPKALTARSLVSRNIGGEEWWMPVKGLYGTTLTIYGPTWAWFSETQTVNLWARQPIEQVLFESTIAGTTYSIVNKAGTAANPITYSGGWNSSDMSVQSGDTLISGVWGWGYGLYNQLSYINVEKLSFMRYDKGFSLRSWSTGEILGCNYNVDGVVWNSTNGVEIYNQSYSIRNCTINVGNVVRNFNVGVNTITGAQSMYGCNITFDNITWNGNNGINIGYFFGSTITINRILENYNSNFVSTTMSRCNLTINSCKNGGRVNASGHTNLSLAGISDSNIKIGTCSTIYRTAVKTLEFNNTNNNRVSIDNLLALDNGNGSSSGLSFTASNNNVVTIGYYLGFALNKKAVLDGAGCYNTVYGVTTYLSIGNGRTTIPNYGGVATDHRTFDRHGTILSDTTTVNTAGSGAMSWKLTSNVAAYPIMPLTLPLAKVFATANSPITFTCYVRRSSTSENCGLKINGGIVSGIPDDVVSLSSAAVNVWTPVSITVTPTTNAVIELLAVSYGAAGPAWFDDLSIT